MTMFKIIKIKSFFTSLVFLLTVVFSNNVLAEIDLSNHHIKWVVPFSAGGGADVLARFYAPLLSEYLPGKPIVEVINMPGAGSTKGANWFSSEAPIDGSVIFSTSGSTQFPFLLGDPRVKYDYKDWEVILASSTGGVAYLSKELGALWNINPQLTLDENYVFASQGPTRLDLVPLLAWNMLGMKVEPIFGVKGRADGRLMFEQGYVNIDYQTSSSFLAKVMPLVEKGDVVPIMTWGILDDNGSIIRDPNFPDIPTFREVYIQIHGAEPIGSSWDAWKAFFIAGFSAQKMVVIDKKTDPEIINAFSKAFENIINEPSFNSISEKYIGIYPQSTGYKAIKFKEIATQIDPVAITWVKDWLNDSYNLDL
ncbi:tricarboxylate transporter [Candidatus Thioglobus sp.]|nr:tricarboxylate transporter [Candidatus Thioglobus sp.]